MSNPPSSTKQAKQSSHLAPRDELGAWQARQNQTRLTQRRKGAKIPESLLNFAPLRLCVRQKKHLLEHGASKLATASWSAVAERRERSLASATPLSSVHRFPQTLLALAKRCRASLPTALQNAGAHSKVAIPKPRRIKQCLIASLHMHRRRFIPHPHVDEGDERALADARGSPSR